MRGDKAVLSLLNMLEVDGSKSDMIVDELERRLGEYSNLLRIAGAELLVRSPMSKISVISDFGLREYKLTLQTSAGGNSITLDTTGKELINADKIYCNLEVLTRNRDEDEWNRKLRIDLNKNGAKMFPNRFRDLQACTAYTQVSNFIFEYGLDALLEEIADELRTLVYRN